MNKQIARGIGAGYISRVANITLNLTLIPILFRNLPQDELGLWILIAQSGLLLGLLDFGVGVTLTRWIAFSSSTGGSPTPEGGASCERNIHDLIRTGQHIYRFLALGAFGISAIVGHVFLSGITIEPELTRKAFVAWALLCASYSINTLAAHWLNLLNGLGHVSTATLLGSLIQVINMLLKIGVALMGGGIVALAIVEFTVGIAGRQLVRHYGKTRLKNISATEGSYSPVIARDLINPALRAWLTSLGSFLLLRTDQYFIATQTSTSRIPSYHATYTVFENMRLLAVSMAGVSSVFLSRLWQEGKTKEFRALSARSLSFGIICFLPPAIWFSLNSEFLLRLWLGDALNYSGELVTIFLIGAILRTQQSIFASSVRSTEYERFHFISLAAACINLILSYLLIQSHGLAGLAVATILAELCTTNIAFMIHFKRRCISSLGDFLTSVLNPVRLPLIGVAIALLLSQIIRDPLHLLFTSMAAIALTSTKPFLDCIRYRDKPAT